MTMAGGTAACARDGTLPSLSPPQSLLVKPERALEQMQDETRLHEEIRSPKPGGKPDVAGPPSGPTEGPQPPPPPERKLNEFHGAVRLDATRFRRDAEKIAEEVIQHLLVHPGCSVDIDLEIRAWIPDGAPDALVRTITENCNTLRFTTYEFEEE